MRNETCPQVAQWRDFSLGRVAEDLADGMGNHLEECPACLATVQSLHDQDTLTDAMRRPSPQADTVATELIDEVAVRLRFRPSESSLCDATHEATARQGEATLDFRQFDPVPPKPTEQAEGGIDLGEVISHYRISRRLGEGGMGVVLEAEDLHLRRTVALKVMKARVAERTGARERFLREAQAAAAIEHENIISIYHVGEEKGVVFAAMPLLQGESLEQRMKREPSISLGESLRIVREIATGLAAAHAQKLIHRDIKPANIWLEAGTERVKILDFGLARPIHESATNELPPSEPTLPGDAIESPRNAISNADTSPLTQQGAILGTPAYMAPEQAQAKPLDGRCDLFSLGCVFYRLVTGRMPFIGVDTMSTLYAVNFYTPKPPREFNPALPVDVEQIILGLLAKKPTDRIALAQEVVDRIRSIERRFARQRMVRHWAAPVLAASVLLMLGVAYSQGPAIYRLATNQGEVVLETDDPDIEVVVKKAGEKVAVFDRKTGGSFNLVSGEYHAELTNKAGDLVLIADQFRVERNGKIVLQAKRLAPATVRFHGEKMPWRLGLRKHEKIVREIALDQTRIEKLSPGHYELEWIDAPKGLKVSPRELDLSAGATVQIEPRAVGLWLTLKGHGGPVWGVDSAQNLVLSGSADRTLSVWNLTTGEEAKRLKLKKPIQCVALSRDGRFAVAGLGKDPNPDFHVYLWDLTREDAVALVGHTSLVKCVAISPDGKHAVSGDVDGSWIVWNLATQKMEKRHAGQGVAIESIAFAPQGDRFATASNDGIRLWDVATGQGLDALTPTGIRCLAISPDGTKLVTGGFDHAVRLWDLATKRELHTFTGHTHWVVGVAFSPDGKRIATGGADKTVRLWGVESQKELATFEGHAGAVQAVAFAADGRHAVSAGLDQTVRVWKLP